MGLLFGLILSLLPSDEGHLSLHIYKSLPLQSTFYSPSSSLGLTGRGNCEGVCGGGGGRWGGTWSISPKFELPDNLFLPPPPPPRAPHPTHPPSATLSMSFLSRILDNKDPRTHARTYIHTRTHTQTHARTHTQPHARARAHTHTHTHTQGRENTLVQVRVLPIIRAASANQNFTDLWLVNPNERPLCVYVCLHTLKHIAREL